MVKVREIMRSFVITVSRETTLEEISKIMTNNKIGSVVVNEGQKPIGIVTSEDIVTAIARGRKPEETKAKDMMKREFITAEPDDDILKIVKVMVKRGIKRIPVVSSGRLEGIITEKEILLTTPEMIDVLSEKLKASVEKAPKPESVISGICEGCEGYSDDLLPVAGEWLCEDCRDTKVEG